MVERVRSELETHRRDPYAHGPLIGRLITENQGLREGFDERLRALENRQWWILGIGALLVFEIPLAIYFLK